jgi:hypothetical protein
VDEQKVAPKIAPTRFTQGRTASLGLDIMGRLSSGTLRKAPVETIERVKTEITANCEEIIEIGARIRPLMVGDKQVGWVRGLHSQERKMLKRWIRDPNDFIALTLQHATSFSKEEIEGLQAFEIRSLVEVVRRMSDYDVSLYPYLPAYVTTQSSEALWYGKGDSLTSFENKVIRMPDGKTVTIVAPPDHSRMWATLCNYREQSKKRLEENMNALFIVRPWAGRQADPVANELRSVARQLETGSDYQWERLVRSPSAVNKNDGWGHPGDSVEDLRRELKGMMEGDKHERLMDAWARQMEHEAKQKQKDIEEFRKKRGIDKAGVTETPMTVLTADEVRKRQKALREGTPQPGLVQRREEFEIDSSSAQVDKFNKYRTS